MMRCPSTGRGPHWRLRPPAPKHDLVPNRLGHVSTRALGSRNCLSQGPPLTLRKISTRALPGAQYSIITRPQADNAEARIPNSGCVGVRELACAAAPDHPPPISAMQTMPTVRHIAFMPKPSPGPSHRVRSKPFRSPGILLRQPGRFLVLVTCRSTSQTRAGGAAAGWRGCLRA